MNPLTSEILRFDSESLWFLEKLFILLIKLRKKAQAPIGKKGIIKINNIKKKQ